MPATAAMNVSYPQEGAYANVQGQRLIANTGGGVAIQPAGGGTDVALIKGLAGLVQSNKAIAQELTEVGKSLAILNQRTMRTMGSAVGTHTREATVTMTEKEFAAALSAAVVTVVNEASNATNAPWHVPVTADGSIIGPPDPGPVSAGPRRPKGSPPPLDGGDGQWSPPRRPGGSPVAPEARARPAMDPWEQVERGRSYDVGKLRQDLAGMAQQKISETTWGSEITRAAGPFLPGQEEASGLFTNVGGGGASQAAIGTWNRRQRILGAAKGVSGTMAEGGSLGQGLSAVMPKSAALAGKALGVVGIANTALNFAESQRAANMDWQASMGGSNAEGFIERGRSRRFALQQMGTMSNDSAQELYAGVTKSGLRGGAKDSALNFAMDAYRNLGMTVTESVALINTAANEGATSFGFLATSLRSVTKAAREAGVNAQVARAQFTQNMASATPLAGIQGAASIATAQTNAGMAYGKEIGSKIDFTAANSDPRQLLQQAASAGMTPNEYLAQSQDPAQAGKFLRQQAGSLREKAGSFLGAKGKAMVAQAIQANGGKGLTEAQYKALSLRYMREGGTFQATQVEMVQRQMGVGGLTMATAIPYLMKTWAGKMTNEQGNEVSTDAGVRHAEDQEQRGITQGTAGSLSGDARAKALGQLGVNEGELGGVGKTAGSLGSMLTMPMHQRILGGVGPRSNAQEQTGAAKIAMAQAQKTGRSGGISFALASKDHFQGDRRFRVQTAHGERLVTTDDLLKHYRDQADAGTAMIESGANAGQSVAQAVGMSEDTSVQVTSATNKNIGKHGKSVEDGGGGGKGKVTIAMSPDLQRWFRVNGTGIASTDPSAGNSPPNSRINPGNLPGDSR